MKNMAPYLRRNGRAAGNKVLPEAGLNCSYEKFVKGSTLVLLLNFCAKNPRPRQFSNRYLPR